MSNQGKRRGTLLYLTLNGKDASKESRKDLISGENYHRISYKEDIKFWLKNCIKELDKTTYNRLIDAINQYCEIIDIILKS